MTKSKYFTFAAALALAAGATNGRAQNADALVDALVKKGVLSSKEAQEIRTDMQKDAGASSAEKIKLSNSITELKLYGDLRLRYEYENKDAQLDPFPVGVSQDGNDKDRSASGTQRSRYRFRLRLNADFKLADNFFGGVELQTNAASDSGNQTFQDGFDDYPIFISKAFIGYNVTDWMTVIGGKMANPFYHNDGLVWDPDVNPTGVTEAISFHKLFAASSAESVGLSKDGKSMPVSKPAASPWEATLVAGQFLFDDNAEGAFDNDSATDAFLFETQLIASYKFAGGSKLTIAPGWLTYINGSVGGLQNNNAFQDRDDPADDASGVKFADVSGATRNLNLLLLPGDYTFKVAGLKTRFYWDFSYNIEGRKRTEDIYNLVAARTNGAGVVDDPDDFDTRHSHQDNYAYLVGVQFGENKKKGDWSILANWRQTGIGAVDPNLNDSDYAGAELNTRGFKLGAAYNFTDFAVGAITYMHAWNLRDDLAGGEATGGNAIADSNAIQVLQVDLSVKF